MRKMQVAVENVIRGDIQNQHVAVFYFTWAGGFDGPQPLGMWTVGSRRILWLRRDGSVLRTACDGWDSCTWGVYSGKHQKVRRSPESIDRALADILLSRGDGYVNETQFAGAILRGAPVADTYTIDNYRQLALTDRGVVKDAACEALWIVGHDPVLRAFAADSIHRANCHCPVVRGELDCGSITRVRSDPPY
jgi:hypothetical protein